MGKKLQTLRSSIKKLALSTYQNAGHGAKSIEENWEYDRRPYLL
jgi:hypothetical protein